MRAQNRGSNKETSGLRPRRPAAPRAYQTLMQEAACADCERTVGAHPAVVPCRPPAVVRLGHASECVVDSRIAGALFFEMTTRIQLAHARLGKLMPHESRSDHTMVSARLSTTRAQQQIVTSNHVSSTTMVGSLVGVAGTH
jgi:hypothetical protein